MTWAPKGAANVIFRRRFAAADNPDAPYAELVRQCREELMHP